MCIYKHEEAKGGHQVFYEGTLASSSLASMAVAGLVLLPNTLCLNKIPLDYILTAKSPRSILFIWPFPLPKADY